MKKAILRTGLALVGLGLLSGCATERQEFVENLNLYGSNPYIEAPHVKDLELRMRKIVLAERLVGPEFRTNFDPRNKAILDNFKDSYSHAELLADMELTRIEFETAVANTYPVIGSETGCEVVNKDAYFFNTDDEPTSFDWEFVRGSCEDGLAHGIGELRADQSNARFVGEFDRGVMIDGLFTMQREDGRWVTQIGGIPGETYTARLLSTRTNKNGYQWHLYGDFNDRGQFDGFATNIWGYTNQLHVSEVGQYKQDDLNGFGLRQIKRDYDGGKVMHVWLGFYRDDTLNGWGAWSNTIYSMTVGLWTDGSLNGIGYNATTDYGNSMHTYYVGNYIDGDRQGPFKLNVHGIFGENDVVANYEDGYRVDDFASDFDFGQVIALTAGAVAIGSADIDTTSMAEIGGAFAADVLGDTGGTNMQSLQGAYNARLANTQSSAGTGGSTGGTSTAAGEKLNEFETTITCPDTGVTSDITIPYRTEACRVAALDFAKTFSCNKTDQDRVTQNCQSACGHPQCLQQ
ncbi:hypothetical protein [Thalassospira sp.]|uniref:hypothetical protein n=1 Tax=Thalassospira sp. TaxID=1912094 RepID=UPI000C4EEDAF|nr:hypothetical protein [Thalassospira sp.]MBC07011.1 hypothetical protein [Thalassospira sp.]|tara:strand:- start:3564 stop:5114 length:1551 start_codon:yes stop_codon:yes gene_type:complete